MQNNASRKLRTKQTKHRRNDFRLTISSCIRGSIQPQTMRNSHRGFTQVELIVSIVLIGILSAVAVPRLSGNSGVAGPTFTEMARSTLRFAQKTAIASRRLVCVELTGSTLRLFIASAADASSCDTPLASPGGESPYTLDANDSQFQGATKFSSSVPTSLLGSALHFDALGRPRLSSGTLLSTAATLQVSGGGTIVIEAETGHVH